jgi:hypothetical protein
LGHYFWDKIVNTDPPKGLTSFRSIFGDEQRIYADALQHYYKVGVAGNWEESFISQYASSHPWEDWAETWAHYIHIMDMVETAYFFGLTFKPKSKMKEIKAKMSIDPVYNSGF